MSASNPPLAIVVTTTSTQQQADDLAESLVTERLAACVQISGPIRSHYRWNDQIQCDEEYRLMIKTHVDHWKRLEARIRELHPYEVPQILMLNVEAASLDYRNWLLQETRTL